MVGRFRLLASPYVTFLAHRRQCGRLRDFAKRECKDTLAYAMRNCRGAQPLQAEVPEHATQRTTGMTSFCFSRHERAGAYHCISSSRTLALNQFSIESHNILSRTRLRMMLRKSPLFSVSKTSGRHLRGPTGRHPQRLVSVCLATQNASNDRKLYEPSIKLLVLQHHITGLCSTFSSMMCMPMYRVWSPLPPSEYVSSRPVISPPRGRPVRAWLLRHNSRDFFDSGISFDSR